MIKEFVAAWDSNKTKLEEYLKTHEQSTYSSYKELVKVLFDVVINPYYEENLQELEAWNSDRITIIDDGNYQGTEIFMIPKDTYQPSVNEYVWTYQYYGSCSGCDTLLAISGYEDGLPTEEQVKDYMALELHLLQRCKYMIPEEIND